MNMRKNEKYMSSGFIQSLMTTLLLLTALSVNATEQSDKKITVYKSPTCDCCNAWIKHLKENGFEVVAENHNDMPMIKGATGILPQHQSCHTAFIGNYFIEGHVPANDIKRLLREKPDAAGLSVPGMPMGSPGMEGPRKDSFSVLLINKNGSVQEYSQY